MDRSLAWKESRRTRNKNKTHTTNTYEVQYTIARAGLCIHLHSDLLWTRCVPWRHTVRNKWFPKVNPETLEGRSTAEPGCDGTCLKQKKTAKSKVVSQRIVVIPGLDGSLEEALECSAGGLGGGSRDQKKHPNQGASVNTLLSSGFPRLGVKSQLFVTWRRRRLFVCGQRTRVSWPLRCGASAFLYLVLTHVV